MLFAPTRDALALVSCVTILTLGGACSDSTTTAADASPDTIAEMDRGPVVDTLGSDAAADAQPQDAQPQDAAPDALSKESNCADNKDNDGDKLVDCLDPDCDQKACRAPLGICDVVETCQNSACPADTLQLAGTTCRPGGPCDIEEKCVGTSPSCPPDKVAPSTTTCRASGGPCDPAETCDGVLPACPVDALLPAGTLCKPSTGDCDIAEYCDGLTGVCPTDKLAPGGTVCRPKAGDCDLPETCSGKDPTCGADLVLKGGVQCRASVGTCDAPEICSGSSPTCPADNTGCLSTYYCNGSQCVAKQALGTSCSSDAVCLSGGCVDGVCCDSKTCTGPCKSCTESGKVGTCVTHAYGTDPEKGCGAYNCSAGGTCMPYCSLTCTKSCKASHYCKSTACVPQKKNGASCTKDCQCASGSCHSGICCDTACDSCCQECSTGTCKNLALDAVPLNSGCCGAKYTCNGKGGCRTSCVDQGLNCSSHCKAAYWCWAGSCVPDLTAGKPCVGGCQCDLNICAFFLCWIP
jgi:hypothetical protein